jgi:glycosyltransferase involved in cell wall biosynthesis
MKRAIRKIIHRYQLSKILAMIKPDIIHLHLGSFGFWGVNRTANKYALKHKIKIFNTSHNEPAIHFGPINKRYLLKQKNIRHIALHEAMRDEIKAMFSLDNTKEIKNGIDIDRFKHPLKSRKQMRSELGIAPDGFLIGNIGRMAAQKNHSFLLRIFAKVVEQKANAHLLLVGDGDLADAVHRQIAELHLQKNVTILSNRQDIPELLNAMDVFVLPSLYEGLGIVLIEAQAVGIRCVVSERVPRDAFVTNKIVSLHLENPVSDWCEAILNDKMAGDIIENRLEEYDMRKVVKTLQALYLEGN